MIPASHSINHHSGKVEAIISVKIVRHEAVIQTGITVKVPLQSLKFACSEGKRPQSLDAHSRILHSSIRAIYNDFYHQYVTRISEFSII